MATTTPKLEETFTPGAPGPLPNEVDNNNPLDYHSSDSDASDSTIADTFATTVRSSCGIRWYHHNAPQ
eukprot:2683274-Amphidinium_carterae.1